MNNLTQTQLDAKQAYLNRQQEQMLAQPKRRSNGTKGDYQTNRFISAYHAVKGCKKTSGLSFVEN